MTQTQKNSQSFSTQNHLWLLLFTLTFFLSLALALTFYLVNELLDHLLHDKFMTIDHVGHAM
jgi:uncharacterized iron-regulated membrane protein